MKALSLWQPWASLMAVGAKQIETRSWSTSYRGLIAIHAAKKWDSELKAYADKPRFRFALEEGDCDPAELPRGCFVAVGKLHRCLSTTRDAIAIPAQVSDEWSFGDYSPDRFMWIFDGVWRLSTPIFDSGHQGLWNVDEDVAEMLIDLLPDETQDLIQKGNI